MQASSPAADHATRPCPIGRAGDLLGDRWTLLILRDATNGITRFDGFKENLGIADNILAVRLRRLVDAGVLVKVPYRDGNRTRHEYLLTQAGADLLPLLRALADWGTRYTAPATEAAPMRMLHAGCGGEVNVAGVCGSCELSVPREEELWLRPWRSADPAPLASPAAARSLPKAGRSSALTERTAEIAAAIRGDRCSVAPTLGWKPAAMHMLRTRRPSEVSGHMTQGSPASWAPTAEARQSMLVDGPSRLFFA
jgi:DNA-binding HxlR family transcriptional regulator